MSQSNNTELFCERDGWFLNFISIYKNQYCVTKDQIMGCSGFLAILRVEEFCIEKWNGRHITICMSKATATF